MVRSTFVLAVTLCLLAGQVQQSEAFLGGLGSAIGKIGSSLASGVGSLGSSLGKIGSSIGSSLGSLGSSLTGSLGKIGSSITSGLGSLGSKISSGLSAIGGLGSKITGGLSKLSSVVTSGLSHLGKLGTTSLTWAKNAGTKLTGFIKSSLPKITSLGSGIKALTGILSVAQVGLSLTGAGLNAAAQNEAKNLQGKINNELPAYLNYAYCQMAYVTVDLQDLNGQEAYDSLLTILSQIRDTYNGLQVAGKPALAEDKCPPRCSDVPARQQAWKEVGCAPRCDQNTDTMASCTAKTEAIFAKIEGGLKSYEDFQAEIQRENERVQDKIRTAGTVGAFGKRG